jgi:hypothetical protein
MIDFLKAIAQGFTALILEVFHRCIDSERNRGSRREIAVRFHSQRAVSRELGDYTDEYYGFWQRLAPDDQLRIRLGPVWGDAQRASPRQVFRGAFLSQGNRLSRRQDNVNHSLCFEAKTFLHELPVLKDKLDNGFAAPDASWFKGKGNEYVRDTLFEQAPRIYEFTDRGTTQTLVNERQGGKRNRRLFICPLMSVGQ